MQRREQEEVSRPIGLLDVDGTLLNLRQKPGESLLNYALIDAYRELGIKDIYIFTNMSLDTLAAEFDKYQPLPLTRQKVVEELEQLGFKVHGVITPADVGYNRGDQPLGASYRDFYLPLYSRLAGPEGPSFDSTTDKEFITLRQTYSQLNKQGNAIEILKALSASIGYENRTKEAFNVKGNIYKYFLEKKPKWVSSIIFSDDEFSCVASVQAVSDSPLGKELDPKASLSTLLITNGETGSASFVNAQYEDLKAKYKSQMARSIGSGFNTVYTQLLELETQIKELPSIYKEIEGKVSLRSNKKDIESLSDHVRTIMRSIDPPDLKVENIINLLIKRFEELKQKYAGEIKFFTSKNKTFIQELNSNPSHHHYARLVALLLKRASDSPDATIRDKYTSYVRDNGIHTIVCPEKKGYEMFMPHTEKMSLQRK